MGTRVKVEPLSLAVTEKAAEIKKEMNTAIISSSKKTVDAAVGKVMDLSVQLEMPSKLKMLRFSLAGFTGETAFFREQVFKFLLDMRTCQKAAEGLMIHVQGLHLTTASGALDVKEKKNSIKKIMNEASRLFKKTTKALNECAPYLLVVMAPNLFKFGEIFNEVKESVGTAMLKALDDSNTDSAFSVCEALVQHCGRLITFGEALVDQCAANEGRPRQLFNTAMASVIAIMQGFGLYSQLEILSEQAILMGGSISEIAANTTAA